jgi:hypothetical protein
MLSEYHKERIKWVAGYIMTSSNDWFAIKMQIINSMNPKNRVWFSRRHHSTKKHILNDFDREVIAYWKELTGVDLWINPSKLHDPNWRPGPAGIFRYNEKRKQNTSKNNI